MQEIQYPESFDWTTQGKITPVKDQGFCGVSWAFAATAYVESVNSIRNNNLEQFSEQNLIDCTYEGNWDNRGCQGGLAYNAFRYI